MSSLRDRIQANPALKRWVHRLMVPRGQARPRLWVSLLVNPLKHKRGEGLPDLPPHSHGCAPLSQL
jgi:hypothetical protein